MNRIGSWLIDMDGVFVREEHPIPGADRFVELLRERGASFLALTNNSMYTPRDLLARLSRSGLDVGIIVSTTPVRPGSTASLIGTAR